MEGQTWRREIWTERPDGETCSLVICPFAARCVLRLCKQDKSLCNNEMTTPVAAEQLLDDILISLNALW